MERSKQTDHTIRNIREKFRHDLVVTKADKGNSVVILKRIDYNLKMCELLRDMNAILCNDFDFHII